MRHRIARKHPGEFIQYNVLYKCILGISRTPRLDSEDVERMRKGLCRSKDILRNEYARGMVRRRSVGDTKIRSWLKRDIGGVLRAMNQADFDIKALPPATKEE